MAICQLGRPVMQPRCTTVGSRRIRAAAGVFHSLLVGDIRWQHGTARFCKPVATKAVKYFEHTVASEPGTQLAET